MQQAGFVIAIDGPSGVGKSTVARAVAAELGLIYVESGAMYRAVALLALETGTPLDDAKALGELAGHVEFRFETGAAGNRIWLNGRDVTETIRSPQVTRAASLVSVHPEVRTPLVERQRQMAQQSGVVMEGRDIGTVVFPDANLKIFLDASPEIRGQRRMQDSEAAAHAGGESVLSEIAERDQRDATRNVSPLIAAADAIHIDTAHLSPAEVVRQIVGQAQSRRASGVANPRGSR